MKIVITGGGTGGHIYPALSIIDGLKKECNELEVIYIGTDNRMESKMIPELGYEFVGLEMQGVNRKNVFKNFKLIYLLIKNFFVLRNIFKKRNIDVVIGTGGYVTVPVIFTASKMKIPTLIFDADVEFGMATKKLMKHANVICSGFENPSKKYPNVEYTGNPRGQLVYSTVHRDKIENKVLFVFGSLGSETLNAFFKEYFNNTELDYDVKYVTGKDMYDEFVDGLSNERVDVVAYVDDISSELENVKYVVTRSGATFVSELAALAIPAIFIPSPYVANNEQEYNIIDLIENELSYMIREAELNSNDFLNVSKKLSENAETISEELKKRRKVDSLDLIVDKVRELADGSN